MIHLRRWFVLISLVPGCAYSQVNNDDINNRINLELDAQPFRSSTKRSTVQLDCINRSLTNKCLVYHNDQWFTLAPAKDHRYFLNILNQECQGLKGVQILIIEGDPCVTSTYKVIQCVPFVSQDDVFISLDSMRGEISYLVNIDGFLGDQCDFEIQFSSKPIGIPLIENDFDTLSMLATVKGMTVELQWRADQELRDSLMRFEIFRKNLNDTRFSKQADIGIAINSLGRSLEHYKFIDSVAEEGEYKYIIIGVSQGETSRVILDKYSVSFNQSVSNTDTPRYLLQIPINFDFPGQVEVVVVDATTERMLTSVNLADGKNVVIPVDVTQHVSAGVRYFRVIAKHLQSGNRIAQRFFFTEDRELVRVKM